MKKGKKKRKKTNPNQTKPNQFEFYWLLCNGEWWTTVETTWNGRPQNDQYLIRKLLDEDLAVIANDNWSDKR